MNSQDGWTFPSSGWDDYVGSAIERKLAEILSSAQAQAESIVSQARASMPKPYAGEDLDKLMKEYKNHSWEAEIAHIDYI